MSVSRIWLVARTLMRQNRVLIALLLLWPFVLSAILLIVEHGAPSTEDVSAILEQELFYGLVLVGLAAAVALGTELRAHRAQQVLGRAVGRAEYLLALGLSAYLPFAGYVLIWLINAAAWSEVIHRQALFLGTPVAAELSAGLMVCAVGLFFSVFAGQMWAALCTGIALAALLGAGSQGWAGVAPVFAAVIGRLGANTVPWRAAGEAVGCAIFLFGVALLLFPRKDLKRV